VQPFAEFAIADDVDADIGLLAHDLGDRVGEAGFESGLVKRLAVFDQSPKFDQLRRPDQAADMGGEDAFSVVRHVCVSPQMAKRNPPHQPAGYAASRLTRPTTMQQRPPWFGNAASPLPQIISSSARRPLG